MKKAGAFILLISLCYYHFISLVIVEAGLLSHKRPIEYSQKTERTITLSLTQEEFQMYSYGDNELYIKGELFDIEKMFPKGDEILVYCIADKSETKMLTELETFFSQNVPQEKSSVPNLLFKFLSLVYVPSFYYKGFNINESAAISFHGYLEKTVVLFFPVSTPPPRG